MTDDQSISGEGYQRGAIAFVGGMAFFLTGLAVKLMLLKGIQPSA